MFHQSQPPAVSADYRLVSDPADTSSSIMVELSPSSSSEEPTLEHQLQSSAGSAYSPTTLSKTGTAQANDLIDMIFPTTSNLLFFAGAFCQTIVSIWDYKSAKAFVNDNNQYDDDDYVLTRADEVNYLFYTLGPVLFFCKAVLDIRRSVMALSRKRHEYDMGVDTKEAWWNLAAAVLFCLGAVFATYDTILYDAHEDEDDADDDTYLLQVAASRRWFGSEFKMNEVAAHLYLVSGVIYLSLHAGCFRGWRQHVSSITSPILSVAHRMMLSGTALFVVGTVMDVALAYLYDPQTLDKIDHDDAIPATDLSLSKANLASSILWNLAPTTYLLVDVFVRRYLHEQTGNSTWTSNDSKDGQGNEVTPFV